MVYRGPSSGCQICRKRRVKCDETRPACRNCVRRRQVCPGFKDEFEVVLKDQTDKLAERIRRKKRPQAKRQQHLSLTKAQTTIQPERDAQLPINSKAATSPVPALLSPTLENESLCFLFTNYINVPRDELTNRGWFEYLLPVYSNALPESPLVLATAAVATNLHTMWRYQGTDQAVPRSFYAKAVTSTNAALQDPRQNRGDNLLLAVLLLDFYDTVSGRFSNRFPAEQHQDGALALIKYRGTHNFKTDLAKRLLISIRHRAITAAIEGRGQFEYEGPLWDDDGDMPTNPAIELDKLSATFGRLQQCVAQVASLQRLINGLDSSDPSYIAQAVEDAPEVSLILREASRLELQLLEWYKTMPLHWQPAFVNLSGVHPSIAKAGAYGDHCEVFIHIHVARVVNMYRCTRILVLQIMDRCWQVLEAASLRLQNMSRAYLADEIQILVDEICATVPFHLGSRTMPSSPFDDWEMQYPCHPSTSDFNGSLFMTADAAVTAARRTVKDHVRSAATMGGWFLLSVLLSVFKAVRPPRGSSSETPPQLALRKGQVQWILSQLRRIQKIYLIPTPS